MNFPIILQDINNNLLTRNIVVTNANYFIKSYKKFNIRLVNEYNLDYDGNIIEDEEINPLDDPKIYSVVSPTNIKNGFEFSGVDANYSYTIYLGKSPKELNFVISDVDGKEGNFLITLYFKPDNILNDEQEHYNSLLVNNNLPSYEKLAPAIIDENHQEVVKRILLDFQQILKYKGTIKSIEQFLYFIGFNPNSIKILPEYITPNKTKTINPNKEQDVKTGYYHIIYDAFEWQDPRWDRKNLPNVINAITDFREFFDKLLYALLLANDYFTINEQQMSFFGTNNMVNQPKFLSLTTQYTQVQKFNTINLKDNVNINIHNRTLIDSKNKDIILNNIQLEKNLQISEIKIYEGLHIKQNPSIYRIERELSDNDNDTNLTDEEELKIKYIFGNVLNIKVNSNYSRVKYVIKNIENELIQYKSELIDLTTNALENKIVIELFGKYVITFYVYDYKGNRTEYFYDLELNTTNIDFKIFNSTTVLFNQDNKLNQSIDSPIKTRNINSENNLILLDSATNSMLLSDLTNYFDIVDNYPSQSLFGNKQYKLPMLNHNIKMNDLTETLCTDFVDNFLNIMSIKKNSNYTYEFDENLFVRLMNIVDRDDNSVIEQHYFISTKESSININEFLYNIKIINNDPVNPITWTLNDMINNDIPEEMELKNTIIPVNFDFDLDLDNNITIESVFPRLKNIDLIVDNNDNNMLKLGDILVCNIDDRYIVGHTDLNWKIVNAFTNKTIKESNELTLKHRINEKVLYNIILTFKIQGNQYQIIKNSIQTSFTL